MGFEPVMDPPYVTTGEMHVLRAISALTNRFGEPPVLNKIANSLAGVIREDPPIEQLLRRLEKNGMIAKLPENKYVVTKTTLPAAKRVGSLGGRPPRPVVINGVIYPSVTSAAAAVRVTTGTIILRIARGTPGYWYADEELPGR